MGPIVASYEHEPIRGLLVSRFSNMKRPPPFLSVGWRSERMAAEGRSRIWRGGKAKWFTSIPRSALVVNISFCRVKEMRLANYGVYEKARAMRDFFVFIFRIRLEK